MGVLRCVTCHVQWTKEDFAYRNAHSKMAQGFRVSHPYSEIKLKSLLLSGTRVGSMVSPPHAWHTTDILLWIHCWASACDKVQPAISMRLRV